MPTFHPSFAADQFSFSSLTNVDCNICQKETSKKILFQEGQFTIFKCYECGLIFVSPHPPDDELDDYYGRFFSEAEESDPEMWRHQRSFQQIRQLIQSMSQVCQEEQLLEIGSGYGYFLKHAKELGFKRIIGIEPDKGAADHIKNTVEGVQIVQKTFLTWTSEKEQFSHIVMLASLEHFKDPLLVLEKCNNLLQPKGFIVIRVPFLEGFFWLNHIIGKNIVAFGAPRHFYDFSPRSITALLTKTGYQKIKVYPGESEQAKNVFYYSLGRLIKLTTLLGWHLSNQRFLFPFNGSLVAIAQKK